MSRAVQALSCTGVSVRFGGFHALTDVSIDFRAGAVTALIGPNGAGKTTLMNVLSGLQRPTSGQVSLSGKDITRMPTHRRACSGIARSFQIISIYPSMTVFENVRLGVQSAGSRSAAFFCRRVESRHELRDRTQEHLERFGLASRGGVLAGEMSHGEQRALELALSLAGDPGVLLLDEPLAGVGHGELEPFLELIARAIAGRTTVLVEHNMDAVMNLADTIVCLVGGSVLAVGGSDEIRDDARVRRAYLGE
jgi:branched-chain amino acid transport system ATP-binding protein